MSHEEDSAQGSDPLIGTHIPGTSFVLTRRIAEGGMGAVYLGEGFSEQRKVFKFLLPEFARNPVIRDRFEREARAAIRLHGSPNSSPHIVKIDDLVTMPDGRQCMQMEYLDGKTLETHLRQVGRLAPHRAFYLFIQVARGLSDLHRGKIIHRDLKPGNIFIKKTLDNPYHVVLIDLGIAHDARSKESTFRTQTGMSMGTPGYMAVEQFIDAGNVTPSADMYALAIIFWEMLTGALPWGLHDLALLPSRQINEQPTFPVDVSVPPVWIDALVASLSPNIQDRPPSLYELVAVLAMALPADPQRGELSGTEMFIKFGMPMVREAPIDGSTVRAPNRDRIEPLLWAPPRITQMPPVAWATQDIAISPPSNHAEPSINAVATANERAGVATANERAGVAPTLGVSRPTTLSSSVGVAISQTPPQRRRYSRALLGFGAALSAGLVTFAVIRNVPHSNDSDNARHDRDESSRQTPATSMHVDAAEEPAASVSIPADLTTRTALGIRPSDAGYADAGSVAALVDAGSVVAPVDASIRNPTTMGHPSSSTSKAWPSSRPMQEPATQRTSAGSAAPVRDSSKSNRGSFDPDAVEE